MAIKKSKKVSDKKAKKKSRSGLTSKEERFCYEYVLHLNGAKAATLAGYAERSARITASKLLTKPNIAEKIRHMQNNLAETAQVSALRVIQEHSKIAFSSIAHLHQNWIQREEFEALTDEQKACIKSISTKVLKRNVGTKECPDVVDVEYVKIELYDKQKSLDSINQMLGYNAPEKREITGKDGKDLFAAMSDEDLDMRIKELSMKLHE